MSQQPHHDPRYAYPPPTGQYPANPAYPHPHSHSQYPPYQQQHQYGATPGYPPPGAYPMHQAYPPAGYGLPPHGYSAQPPQPPQSQPHSHLSTSDPVVELQWVPHTLDAPMVHQWFSDLDKEGKGIVGGIQIATFLKKSNLPKETLRTIWSLIDNNSLGYVNKSQFNNIIRLVSISCSPIYMGSPPSLERLQKTLYDKIPLPAALVEATAAEEVASKVDIKLNATPSVTLPTLAPSSASTHQQYTDYPAPKQHGVQLQQSSTELQAKSVDEEDDEFSDFASAAPSEAGSSITMSTMGGPSRLDILLETVASSSEGPQWEPSESDAEVIEKWFSDLDADNKGVVGGMTIAMFLKRSNLSKDTLRTIWSLIDNKNIGHVNKQQFTNIIRLVSISCSPIYMGAPPSMERLEKTLSASIPLPAALLETVVSSAEPSTTALHSTVSMQRTTSNVSLGSVGSASASGPVLTLDLPSKPDTLPAVSSNQNDKSVIWTPNHIDAPYIDKWFYDLDVEKKGTIGGMAVVMFLKKTLLPKETLRTIWSIIDTAHAGHINKAQFATMMRLVALQCHPSYSSLPPAIERVQMTLEEFIPLPLSLVQDPVHALPSHQSNDSGSGLTVDTRASVQWIPPPIEADIVNRWFTDLDSEHKGILGGLTIAMFLKRSNLPKESLRTIWSLIDCENVGHVDKAQFTNIIRLVSLLCTPHYAHYAPSLDFLRHTIHEPVPLPTSLFTSQPIEVASMTAPTVAASTADGSLAAASSQEPSSEAAIGTSSVADAEVACASPPSYPQWVPPPEDLKVIDQWFSELDTDRAGMVGGMAIAMFLKRSNLSKDTLRTIWSLVDDKNVGHINKHQFVTAIRLVSICCSPVYMGAPPSMERLRKTINDDISLPFALMNAYMMESSASLPASIPAHATSSTDASDGMREVSSTQECDIGSAVALDRINSFGMLLSSAPANTSSNRLSVFDDLVENDLKAIDEEWDDFADGNQAPAANANMEKNDVDVSNDIDRAISIESLGKVTYEHDMFGSFDGANPQSADEVNILTAPIASEDSFGNFDNISDAPVYFQPEGVVEPIVEDSFGSFDEAELAATQNVTSEAIPNVDKITVEMIDSQNAILSHSGSVELSDPFGSLGNVDSVPRPKLDADEISITAQEVELSDATVPDKKEENVVGATVDNSDPFGSLDQVEDVPLPALHLADDADPFGSFDQGDAPATNQAPAVNIPVGEEQTNQDVFDDDGDDFGDFETHTPIPGGSMAHPTSTGSMLDLTDTPQISQSISELSLFDPPPESNSDMFMQDAFGDSERSNGVATSSAPTIDLLDFLSDPVPFSAQHTSSFPVSFPSESTFDNAGIAQPFQANFEASFDEAKPTASVEKGSFPISTTSKPSNTFESSSAPATSNPVLIPSNLVSRKRLSYQTLEEITATLVQKCLYEHAYNCNEQAMLARSIKELTDRKAQAVEDDDLETAMILKKDINLLQLKVQGIDLEAIWEEEAASNRKGDSLQETVDLLGAIDDIMANKFKKRFLGSIPPSSAPLDTQLSFQITARRYARMILSTCSTHSEYPRQWLLVLQIAVAKVKEGNDIIAQFRQLSAADQTALISHLKMSEYALGLVAISEIGLWVSASCIEAMVHEKIALEVYSVCQDLLAEVDTLWGMGSRFKSMSLETLTLEAAKLTENKMVQCCNFTLRPMSYEVYKPDGDKLRTDRVKLYDNPMKIADAHFMEPVIKLWLHDISTTMPKTITGTF